MIKRILMRIKTKKEEKIKKEEKREQLRKDELYIVSKNADPDNILIDTCALKNEKGIYIIEESEKVNVLYAVLEEMDKKKGQITRKQRKSQEECDLISNISKYSTEMLEKTKYNLILYCNKNNEYVDDVILRYLKSRPKRKRPTLLTADKLFVAKAKCLHLEYIFIAEKQAKKKNKKKKKTKKVKAQKANSEVNPPKDIKPEITETQTPTKQTNKNINVVGVLFSYIENNVTITKYCRQSIIFLVKADECKEISSNIENIDSKTFDYIVAIKYMTKYKMVRISKITIEKENIIQDISDCKFVNEIYKLPIHETVLEEAKNQIVRV